MHIILCHGNLYYDWFFRTAYYADVLFMSYFCKNSAGSYFIFLSWIYYDFNFLLNLSLYRQYYFWDVDACCKPRKQLFVKFNDCWQQLNSHELVAKISKAPTDYVRKCYLWHTWPNCDPVMSLIFLVVAGLVVEKTLEINDTWLTIVMRNKGLVVNASL